MAINRLPREALNSGVRMTVMAMSPTKKGPNDQALCGGPLIKKAGACQTAQTTPRVILAHNGENRRCSRGKASPRQPNSSPSGPSNRDWTNAGKTMVQDEKGNGSLTVPLIAAAA